MKKMGVLQLALQLNYNSIKTIHIQLLCNFIMGANLLRNIKKLSLGHH
jgi:hypothetical protein